MSARYCDEFLKDMADLQCLLPTHQPKVTDHIEQIKDMIAKVRCCHQIVSFLTYKVLKLLYFCGVCLLCFYSHGHHFNNFRKLVLMAKFSYVTKYRHPEFYLEIVLKKPG